MPTVSTASPRERLQRMSRWMRALIALGALGLFAFIANIAFDRDSGTLEATWHNPPGQRQLQLGVSFEDYLCVLFGGLLIAMAWAMTEASRIEQDNAGFV